METTPTWMNVTDEDANARDAFPHRTERSDEIADVSSVLGTDEDAGFCEICGEHFHPGDELGEFVNGDGDSVIAHSECGLSSGYSIA